MRRVGPDGGCRTTQLPGGPRGGRHGQEGQEEARVGRGGGSPTGKAGGGETSKAKAASSDDSDSGSNHGNSSGGYNGSAGFAMGGSSGNGGKSVVSSLTTGSSSPNDSNSNSNGSGDDSQEGSSEDNPEPHNDKDKDKDKDTDEAYSNVTRASTNEEAADAAVKHLQSIAKSLHPAPSEKKGGARKGGKSSLSSSGSASFKKKSSERGHKRKQRGDSDSGGYKTDDEGEGDASALAAAAAMPPPAAAPLPTPSGPAAGASACGSSGSICSSSSKASGKTPDKVPSGETTAKKTKMSGQERREERNQREKERSFRISKQINELRNLLSSGGVIVPKGTKGAVLSEAANYIRMLQQHQYKSEIDRAQLIQQMQIIGGGGLGPQAATAVRHVATQNGVWSLGNFGGVPPRSAMQAYQQQQGAAVGAALAGQPQQNAPQEQRAETQLITKIDENDYRFVFNSCSVGMAIASMGGAFIDCNSLFCQLSQYSKQEVCAMTIFNLCSRQDLQHAFDLISTMISPPSGSPEHGGNPPPCSLRGAMKHRDDLGLSISLIKGEDGIAKCFNVTLIKNPDSPFDPARPIPATTDYILAGTAPGEEEIAPSASEPPKSSSPSNNGMSTPAYTAG